MSENRIDRNLLALSIVVWAAVAASVIFMVMYANIAGAVFGFMVLIVAIGLWRRVLSECGGRREDAQEKELADQIRELTREIQELKKALEE